MQTIPLAATPNQTFSVVLGDLDVDITLRTLGGELYITVACDGTSVCAGRVCRDRVELVPRAAYLGFSLSLHFADLRGVSDPTWPELGSRFVLLAA